MLNEVTHGESFVRARQFIAPRAPGSRTLLEAQFHPHFLPWVIGALLRAVSQMQTVGITGWRRRRGSHRFAGAHGL